MIGRLVSRSHARKVLIAGLVAMLLGGLILAFDPAGLGLLTISIGCVFSAYGHGMLFAHRTFEQAIGPESFSREQLFRILRQVEIRISCGFLLSGVGYITVFATALVTGEHEMMTEGGWLLFPLGGLVQVAVGIRHLVIPPTRTNALPINFPPLS